MISEAMAGATALKTAFDMAKALKEISDATMRNAAVIELQEKILAAQQAQFAMSQRIDTLESELAAIKKNDDKLHRYQLKDFGGKTFAYELKENEARGEPNHRACAACYQQGHISILQFRSHGEGQDWYECPRCKDNQRFGVYVAESYEADRNEYY